MIFDSLTHATKDGIWFNTTYDCSFEKLTQELDKHNVDQAILSGLTTSGVNDFIINLAKTDDRLYPVPMISKVDDFKLNAEVKRFVEHGVGAIKFHPRFAQSCLSSKLFKTCVELCRKYQLTMFVCTVPYYDNGAKGLDFIKELHEIILNNQDIKFVLLHGGYNQLLNLAESVRGIENCIVDLSATIVRFKNASVGLDVKYLFEHFEKRLCIGTDFPEYDYDDVGEALEHLGLAWSSAHDSGVLGGNLERFLKEC